MRLAVQTSILRNALKLINSVVDSNSIIPCLKGVKIKAENKILTLLASNLLCNVQVELDAPIERPGEVLIEASNLYKLVSNVKDDTLTIHSKTQEFKIFSKTTSAQLPQLPTEDFPVFPELNTATRDLQKENLVFALGAAVVSNEASFQDGYRGCLLGIENDKVIGVGMDTAWLMICGADIDTKFVLPKKIADFLAKSVTNETLGVVVQEDVLFVCDGKTIFSAKLMTAAIPPWKEIKNSAKPISEGLVLRSELLDALKYILALNSRSAISLTMKNDRLLLKTAASFSGEAEQEISIDTFDEEGSTQISGHLLLKAVQHATSERITLAFQAGTEPFLLKADNFTAILAQNV